MKITTTLIFLSCSLLGSCSTKFQYHGLVPIEPLPAAGGLGTIPYWYTEVSSLQPQFRWNGVANKTYDFIIYEAFMVETVWSAPDNRKVATPGAEVLYEEAIAEPRFTLPFPLEQDTDYVWTVRTRSPDGEVSDWAAYDAMGVNRIGPGKGEHVEYGYFWIRTPD